MQALNAIAYSFCSAMAVQGAQHASKDTQAAVLKELGAQEAARQVEVDAESAALQKPETQEAVKQVQVDAESAQLQKPETQQVPCCPWTNDWTSSNHFKKISGCHWCLLGRECMKSDAVTHERLFPQC